MTPVQEEENERIAAYIRRRLRELGYRLDRSIWHPEIWISFGWDLVPELRTAREHRLPREAAHALGLPLSTPWPKVLERIRELSGVAETPIPNPWDGP